MAEPESLVLRGRLGWATLELTGLARSLGLGSRFEARRWPAVALLDSVTDTAQPVEIAVAMDSPETLLVRGLDVALSVPLSSEGLALERLREREASGDVALERAADGAVWIRAAGETSSHCVLRRALGPAPARLICADDRRSVRALAPYLARGLPTRDLGADESVVEAWPARSSVRHRDGLRQLGRFAQPTLGGGTDLSTRLLSAALPVLLDDGLDLLADVEHARGSARRAGDGLELSLLVELGSQGSWLTRATLSTRADSDGARELFSALPRDSELAFFFSGASRVRIDEARAALGQWLRAALGPGYGVEAVDLVVRTFVPGTPFVYAHGDASGADAQTHEGGYAIWERTMSTYGWHIVGYDEPAQGFLQKLDAGMKAHNSGDLSRLAYAALPRLCAGLGKIRKKAAPRGLPRGSVLYELPLPGRFFDACAARHHGTKRPAPNESLVVVLVPHGPRTFIGFGPGEAAMVRRMAALSGGSPDQTLAGVGSLAPIAAPGVRAGGFVTLAGISGLVRFLTMSEPWRHRRDRLERLLNRGRTVVPFAFFVDDGTPARARLEAHLPAGALADFALR